VKVLDLTWGLRPRSRTERNCLSPKGEFERRPQIGGPSPASSTSATGCQGPFPASPASPVVSEGIHRRVEAPVSSCRKTVTSRRARRFALTLRISCLPLDAHSAGSAGPPSIRTREISIGNRSLARLLPLHPLREEGLLHRRPRDRKEGKGVKFMATQLKRED
jgi:hypothetical protein